jgi:hypothetical protein
MVSPFEIGEFDFFGILIEFGLRGHLYGQDAAELQDETGVV